MIPNVILLLFMVGIIAATMMKTVFSVFAEDVSMQAKMRFMLNRIKLWAFYFGVFALIAVSLTSVLTASKLKLLQAFSEQFVALMRNTAEFLFGTRSLFGALRLFCLLVLLIIAANFSLTFALMAVCYLVDAVFASLGRVLSRAKCRYVTPNFSKSNLYLKLKQLRN